MSDTPRTDADEVDAGWIIAAHSDDKFVSSKKVRQLERELNEAKKEIERLEDRMKQVEENYSPN